MKFKIKQSFFSISLLSILVLVGCDKADKSLDSSLKDNTVVILKFKAQPNKGTEAVSAMTNLLAEVKKEPHFVKIKLHVDPNDESNIFFYEEWDDPDYYNGAHMNTPHLQAFMKESHNFLMGPPDITFWKVEKVVK